MRRKLQNQDGVTIVFALVIFLIMALFSYVMVNASLTAVHSTDASRMDEQAYWSVRSAAILLRDALNGQKFSVTKENEQWKNWTPDTPNDVITEKIIIPALKSGSFSTELTVESEKMNGETFGTVDMTIKTSTGSDKISLIFNLSHPNYNMKMTIETDKITQVEDTNQYRVSFEDMKVTFQLGTDER